MNVVFVNGQNQQDNKIKIMLLSCTQIYTHVANIELHKLSNLL